MKKSRTHLAVLAMAATLSLLAACGKEESDTAATGTAPTTEPASAPTPGSTGAESGTSQPSGMDALKDDAKRAGEAISKTAGDVKDATVDAAKSAGEAIREGADKADQKIQEKLGDGKPTTQEPPPPNQG